MVLQESLFFLADFNKYKQAKINLLAAKSGILKSREHIKEIERSLDYEDTSGKKIKKEIAEVRAGIRALKESLPSMKEEMKKQALKEESLIKKAETVKTEKEKIRDEIEEINDKIKELENL